MGKIIYTIDQQNELWSLLGLLESNLFVLDKLKSNNKTVSEKELTLRSENVSYCIRQAREFYKSASQVSILTSPLLLYYGMLNLAKALVYYFDPYSSDQLEQHGLKVKSHEQFSNESVQIKNYGTFAALEKIIVKDNSNKGLLISIKDLLSQIPDVKELFEYIYKDSSKVHIIKKAENGFLVQVNKEYMATTNEHISKLQESLKENKFTIQGGDENYFIFSPVDKLKSLGLIISSVSGADYFRIFPVIDGIHVKLNEILIYYMTIYCYGMLARYQPVRWGKYIDPNISLESEIINKSIQVCKSRFLHLAVNCLLRKFMFLRGRLIITC